jgi:hypothetical protein
MAKKKQSKSRPKSSKPKSKRPASHTFMTARQDDLSALFSATGKGPHKDQVSARLMTPPSDLGVGKPPGSRED